MRQKADDIVHLSHNKQPALFPGVHNSTKNTLINIAELLNRDNTPSIIPLSQSLYTTTSTLERLASSEGEISSTPQAISPPPVHSSEDTISEDIFKRKITPFTSSTKILHPSLYQSRQSTTKPPTQLPLHKTTPTATSSIQTIEQQKIKQLLEEYKNHPKKQPSRVRKPVPILTLKPNISPFYIPLPKKYIPMRPSTKHPMILRHIGARKHFIQPHNFKDLAAQHLLANHLSSKNLHIFDKNRRKESIDSLLTKIQKYGIQDFLMK